VCNRPQFALQNAPAYLYLRTPHETWNPLQPSQQAMFDQDKTSNAHGEGRLSVISSKVCTQTASAATRRAAG
jgi:hypothetical protein